MPAIIMSIIGSIFSSPAMQSLVTKYTIAFTFLTAYAFVLNYVLDWLNNKAMEYAASVSGCVAYFITALGFNVALQYFIGILMWGFFAKQIIAYIRTQGA